MYRFIISNYGEIWSLKVKQSKLEVKMKKNSLSSRPQKSSSKYRIGPTFWSEIVTMETPAHHDHASKVSFQSEIDKWLNNNRESDKSIPSNGLNYWADE